MQQKQTKLTIRINIFLRLIKLLAGQKIEHYPISVIVNANFT